SMRMHKASNQTTISPLSHAQDKDTLGVKIAVLGFHAIFLGMFLDSLREQSELLQAASRGTWVTSIGSVILLLGACVHVAGESRAMPRSVRLWVACSMPVVVQMMLQTWIFSPEGDYP